MTSKPSPTLLALAEANGAVLTGKPDGSEAITVVFTINAWRSFDAALHAQVVTAGVVPIDMVLHCPKCHTQHIDKPEGAFIPGFTAEESAAWNKAHNLWDNPPHRSHKCADCGHIWRPADVCTNGVAAVKTEGKADWAPIQRPVRPRVWMDARWPQWDTADSFVDGDEPDTEQAWVPLYDDAAVQELRQECKRLRETLNFIAAHFSSDWPERCQSHVLAARHALTDRNMAGEPPHRIKARQIIAGRNTI